MQLSLSNSTYNLYNLTLHFNSQSYTTPHNYDSMGNINSTFHQTNDADKMDDMINTQTNYISLSLSQTHTHPHTLSISLSHTHNPLPLRERHKNKCERRIVVKSEKFSFPFTAMLYILYHPCVCVRACVFERESVCV